MRAILLFLSIFAIALTLSACVGEIMTPYPDSEPAATNLPVEQMETVEPVNLELALSVFQKGGCGGCHVIPGAPGATGVLGPDLSRMGEIAAERVQGSGYRGKAETVDAYLLEALVEPDAFLSPDCSGNPCQQGLMPVSLTEALSDDELKAVIGYLAALPDLE